MNEGEITQEMRESGLWLDEATACSVAGVVVHTLQSRRQRGLLRSLPLTRGANGGGRGWWYWREDIEQLAARGRARAAVPHTRVARVVRESDTEIGEDYLTNQLELALAKADAREQEVARARAEAEVEIVMLREQLAAANARMRELELRMRQLTSMVRASVDGLLED